MRPLVRVAVAMVIVCVACVGLHAQSPVRWGLGVIVVPRWEFPDALARVGDSEETLRGAEFGIAVVRARPRSGDWGLSLVFKQVTEGSHVGRGSFCVENTNGAPICARTTYHVMRDASMASLQLHKTWTLIRIGRVAAGLTTSIGAARISGQIDEHVEHLEMSGGTLVVRDEVERIDVQRWMGGLDYVPILGFEPGLTVDIGNNIRARVATGINLPGMRVPGVTVQYYF